jgi:hypothetical protein
MTPLLDWQGLGRFALITFVAAHVLMALLRDRPTAHRSIVYITALLGGISLLSSVFKSEVQLAEWMKPAAEQRRLGDLSLVKGQLEWQRDYYCETKFNRSPFSPPDFDRLVADYAEVCRITKSVIARSKEWAVRDVDITFPEFRSPAFQRPMEQDVVNSVLRLATAYNETLKELHQLK